MANFFVVASTIEGNGMFFIGNGCGANASFCKQGLPIPQKPNFAVALNKINSRKFRDCLIVNSAPSALSSLVTEKDGEFKTSFDEYLKAMESIKAEKEKKKPGDDNLTRENTSQEVEQNGESSGTFRLRKFEESEIRRKVQASECSVRAVQQGIAYGYDFRRGGRSKFEEEKADGSIGVDISKKVPKYNRVILEKSKEVKRSVKITKKNRKGLDEISDDDELGIERIAFKSSEPMDGVPDGPRVSRIEMEERIQKLAKCLNGADIEMPEWMFSKMMRSAKIRFSDHSILRVIQILGKLGNWRRVLQVIEWLQTRERFKSHKLRYVYTAALDALCKAKRPVEALNLFRTMQQRRCTYPDLVAYHCIAVTLGQSGHLKELFDVMDNMKSKPKSMKSGALERWNPQLEPDIVVYNAVLNACVWRKQWEGAFWVLQQLKQVGQRPSGVTYGLVMEVMLASGKYNLVHEFFKKVQRSSVPNALTYRVLVNALWQEGKIDEAAEAVQEMERRGIVGSASLYYDLARCLCSAGRLQEALVQVDKICKVATKPLVVTYTGLIQACLDSGRVQDGAYIFDYMHKHCSPTLVTCNIMLRAYLESGAYNNAKDLFRKMAQNAREAGRVGYKDAAPDIYTFNTMLEACVVHKSWDDFRYAYEQMLCHGYHFNTKRHLWMILTASRAGEATLIEATWRHLQMAHRVPPPSLVKERFLLKMERNDIPAAVSSIAAHPSSHQQSFSKEAWLKLLEENPYCFNQDILEKLMREISVVVLENQSPNLILQNLLDACKEFRRMNEAVAGMDLIEVQSKRTV